MTFTAVYIRVPKTASTSTIRFLPGLYASAHNSYSVARNGFFHKELGTEEDWEALFKFGFVRNPWDRYLSFFFHQAEAGRQVTGTTPEDFRKFLFGLATDGVHLKMRPEVMFAGIELDFVGQFERLEKDLLFIQKKLQITKLAPLTHAKKNETRPREWQGYYDNDTRDRVAELGAWEIERFNYTFEGV